jgi:hypothetical protein
MSSKRSRSLLVRGLKNWLRGLRAGAPPRRRPVRPQVEELERRETPAGTPFLVKDIHPGDLGSYPASTTNVNGTLFFSANDGRYGTETTKRPACRKSPGLGARRMVHSSIGPSITERTLRVNR